MVITSEVESFEGLFLVFALESSFCLKEGKNFIQKSSIEQKISITLRDWNIAEKLS